LKEGEKGKLRIAEEGVGNRERVKKRERDPR